MREGGADVREHVAPRKTQGEETMKKKPNCQECLAPKNSFVDEIPSDAVEVIESAGCGNEKHILQFPEVASTPVKPSPCGLRIGPVNAVWADNAGHFWGESPVCFPDETQPVYTPLTPAEVVALAAKCIPAQVFAAIRST